MANNLTDYNKLEVGQEWRWSDEEGEGGRRIESVFTTPMDDVRAVTYRLWRDGKWSDLIYSSLADHFSRTLAVNAARLTSGEEVGEIEMLDGSSIMKAEEAARANLDEPSVWDAEDEAWVDGQSQSIERLKAKVIELERQIGSLFEGSTLTVNILRLWDRDRIERFALHLLGDEWQAKAARYDALCRRMNTPIDELREVADIEIENAALRATVARMEQAMANARDCATKNMAEFNDMGVRVDEMTERELGIYRVAAAYSGALLFIEDHLDKALRSSPTLSDALAAARAATGEQLYRAALLGACAVHNACEDYLRSLNQPLSAIGLRKRIDAGEIAANAIAPTIRALGEETMDRNSLTDYLLRRGWTQETSHTWCDADGTLYSRAMAGLLQAERDAEWRDRAEAIINKLTEIDCCVGYSLSETDYPKFWEVLEMVDKLPPMPSATEGEDK